MAGHRVPQQTFLRPSHGDSLLPRRRRLFGIVAGAILTPVILAALWPVTFDSREELFEIPQGTWARRMAGETREILPSENYFACTAHASGQLLIVVEAAPGWPWDRLSWRVRRMLRGWSEP